MRPSLIIDDRVAEKLAFQPHSFVRFLWQQSPGDPVFHALIRDEHCVIAVQLLHRIVDSFQRFSPFIRIF